MNLPEKREIIEEVKQMVETPCFVVFEKALQKNMEIIQSVINRTTCKVLLAQKAFSMYHVYPLLRKTLSGVCSSGPYEAQLGFEEFGKEVHAFAAAFSLQDLQEILRYSNHVIFNSFSQFEKFREEIKPYLGKIQFGIRVNPEHSEGHTELYDPCAEKSRMGVRFEEFPQKLPPEISGLHFHTLCQHDSDALARTVTAFEKKFAKFLPQINWMNFGGGHHITREDYDLDLLCETLNNFRKSYPNITEIYLEPGEAIALNAGILVTEVLDIKNNKMNVAIVDASAAAHMPDVLEMPYRPEMMEEEKNGEFVYRFAGMSCLAGDNIGDYSFSHKIETGERFTLLDMAIYSMVKTNTFNGLKLPSIAYFSADNKLNYLKKFCYEDFKRRL